MIRITQFDENLSLYRNNKVVIWGTGLIGRQMFSLFNFLSIEVYAFCDNDMTKWGNDYCGTEIISPLRLGELMKEESIVIQVGFYSADNASFYKQLETLGVKKYISREEGQWALRFLANVQMIERLPQYYAEIEEWSEQYCSKFARGLQEHVISNPVEMIIVCCPPKTGDNTLNTTFDKAGISYYNVFHSPPSINIELLKKVYNPLKIITAVREPISGNLSSVFQYYTSAIQNSGLISNFFLASRRLDSLNEFKDSAIKEGGNAQLFFDYCNKITQYIYRKNTGINNCEYVPVSYLQRFQSNFSENILDTLQRPFDKEKGYAIMKEDNVEVFVYQLEKLNDIIPELSEWVGVPFDKLENANIGADKWTGKAYKQAQKEITFSQEYFDACYNEPYVKHFYSDEDIEKFKARWRPHIR